MEDRWPKVSTKRRKYFRALYDGVDDLGVYQALVQDEKRIEFDTVGDRGWCLV